VIKFLGVFLAVVATTVDPHGPAARLGLAPPTGTT